MNDHTTREMPLIAVYWDFQNIHMALQDATLPGKIKPVNIGLVSDFARGLGTIAVNRAYADWRQFAMYDSDLLNNSIDAVQLFPHGKNSKTGATVRMCADILDDVTRNPHIDAYLLVGGDSDFAYIGQKLREKGKRVYGVGTQEASSRFWISICDEFKFYRNLERLALGPSESQDVNADDAIETDAGPIKRVLLAAIAKINETAGTPNDAPVLMARLKPMILQLVPDFDESTYRCWSFKEFLENVCGDVVQLTQDHPAESKDNGARDPEFRPGPVWVWPKKPVSLFFGTGMQTESDPELVYARILKKTQFRTVPGDKFEPLCQAAFKAAGKGSFLSWEDFLTRVSNELPRGVLIPATDMKHFQSMCYRSRAFVLDAENRLIHLRVRSPAEIEQMILLEILRRIDNLSEDEVDEAGLTRLVFGDEAPSHLAIVSATHAAFKRGVLGNA